MAGRSSSKPWWIGALLLAISILVAALAWQTHATSVAQRLAVESVLEDYAKLATDEFSRRAMAKVGYEGYFTAIRQLQSGNAPERPSPVYRLLDTDDEIAQLIAGNDEIQVDAPFLAIHITNDDVQRTVVLFADDRTGRRSGFEVDRVWLAATLEKILESGSLLPESLGNGRLTNDILDIRFNDSNGAPIIDTRRRWDNALVATKTLTDEYAGIFRGHTVTIAIDPGAAETLLIGGLPRSRVPELLLVLGVLAALLVLSIRQLQREAELARLRNDFVAEVSHELRTPLTQVRVFTESLIYNRLASGEDQTRALSVIDRESRRLAGMVDNVLAFAGGADDDSDFQGERTHLAPLVRRIADDFQPIAEATNSRVALELDEIAEACIDPDALRQVLLNLLDNAIKYGPQHQTVRVSLERTDESVRIAVDDEGPGIPTAERDQIWDSYVRLERDRGSAIAGAGIGLAVVRSLVQRNRGQVHIENTANGGSRFVIELPT